MVTSGIKCWVDVAQTNTNYSMDVSVKTVKEAVKTSVAEDDRSKRFMIYGCKKLMRRKKITWMQLKLHSRRLELFHILPFTACTGWEQKRQVKLVPSRFSWHERFMFSRFLVQYSNSEAMSGNSRSCISSPWKINVKNERNDIK